MGEGFTNSILDHIPVALWKVLRVYIFNKLLQILGPDLEKSPEKYLTYTHKPVCPGNSPNQLHCAGSHLRTYITTHETL